MDDLVIFVHGTFAGDKDQHDDGARWWQRGSATWKWIQSHLPTGVCLSDGTTQLFHWSGANSQTERLAASTRLLGWLIELERQGRGYHLVGHSHGGSVIWETLISSEVMRTRERAYDDLLDELRTRKLVNVRSSRRKSVPGILAYPQIRTEIKLDGLRSWTTIGTPFLHYLPRRRRLINGWPSPSFSLSSPLTLGLRDLGSAMLLVGSVFGIFLGGIGWASNVGRPGVSVDVYASICLAGIFLFFILMSFISRSNLASALIAREHAAHRVIERFTARWLGLWAQSDEAIAALMSLTRSASYDYTWLCLPAETRPTRSVPKTISDDLRVPVRLSPPSASVNIVPEASIFSPLRWITTPMSLAFNRWLSPRLGQAITNILLRTAQGCDLPGAVLAYASPWPLPLEQPFGGLPGRINERLKLSTDKQLIRIAPASREMLAAALLEGMSLPQLVASDRLPVNGNWLVHSSYFEDPDVLRLIVLHISRTASQVGVTGIGESEDELKNWLDVTSIAVTSRLIEFVRNISSKD